jgi:hypothetical protein
VIEVVAFAHALAHAGKYGIAAVLGCDVVNEFLNEHRLPDACAAEKADLAAFDERREEVDCFDACFKNFGFGGLIGKRRRITVYGKARRICRKSSLPSIGSPITLNMRPKSRLPYRHGNRRAGIVTSVSRASPEVSPMAMQRARLSPRCCATSRQSPAILVLDLRGRS